MACRDAGHLLHSNIHNLLPTPDSGHPHRWEWLVVTPRTFFTPQPASDARQRPPPSLGVACRDAGHLLHSNIHNLLPTPDSGHPLRWEWLVATPGTSFTQTSTTCCRRPTAATPFAGSGLSRRRAPPSLKHPQPASDARQRPPPSLGMACRDAGHLLHSNIHNLLPTPDSGHPLRWEWLVATPGTSFTQTSTTCFRQRPPLRWEWLVATPGTSFTQTSTTCFRRPTAATPFAGSGLSRRKTPKLTKVLS